MVLTEVAEAHVEMKLAVEIAVVVEVAEVAEAQAGAVAEMRHWQAAGAYISLGAQKGGREPLKIAAARNHVTDWISFALHATMQNLVPACLSSS